MSPKPNCNIFNEMSGRLKILTIIFGIVAVGLSVDHYYKELSDEEAFFGSIIVCLIVSGILAFLSIIGLTDNDNMKAVDKYFHMLAAILLVIVSSLFIVSVDKHGTRLGQKFYNQRMSAGAFGLINGVLYGLLGWLLF